MNRLLIVRFHIKRMNEFSNSIPHLIIFLSNRIKRKKQRSSWPMHTYIHTYMHAYRHRYMHMHNIHTYIHAHAHMYVYQAHVIHIYVHVIYTYIRHIYIHTYIHPCIHTFNCHHHQSINQCCLEEQKTSHSKGSQ